jgi:thiol-disulfide isomerase/thioredoxin
MSDKTGSSDPASGAATMSSPPTRPGLLRTFAHRLAGDPAELPVEGRLASFEGATGWLNSESLAPEGLRGRVVLVDFWTYTCINWIRTLPYVRAWAAKYADAGLTVVGVHTPEFGFERDLDNIVPQSRDFGVEYPVAIDSDYGVWQAFANHFWPAVYLADSQGRIRFHHFGEGEYAMTEMVIQQLLLDAGAHDIDQDLVTVDPRGL